MHSRSQYGAINFEVYHRFAPVVASEIRNQLREVVSGITGAPTCSIPTKQRSPSVNIPVVVSLRASGKTTGLVHFVGERTLLTSDETIIAVAAPTQAIMEEFNRQFRTHFPTLRQPMYVTGKVASERLRGQKVAELYLEEIFLFKKGDIRDLFPCAPVVVGVGSIEQPRTIMYNL
jgi:hypothetical protein